MPKETQWHPVTITQRKPPLLLNMATYTKEKYTVIYVPFLPVLLVSLAESACRNLMSHCKCNLAWRLYCQMPVSTRTLFFTELDVSLKKKSILLSLTALIEFSVMHIYTLVWYMWLFPFCVFNWPSSLINIFHCSSGPVSIFICCCVTNTDCTPRFDPELVTACKMQKEHYLNVTHPTVLIIKITNKYL